MRQDTYGQRHADLIPSEVYPTPITVVGAGAIGSHTVMSLARMGFSKITVYDDDVVSEENMGSQGYLVADIGKPKVNALADHVEAAGGSPILPKIERVDEHAIIDGHIVIAAVDNMKARVDILKAFMNKSGFFIDPRMGAEYAKLIVMNRAIDDHSWYMKQWYPDSEAVAEACTAKATVYCANILSGFVVKAVKDILTGQRYTRSFEFDLKVNSGMAWDSSSERLF